MAVLNSLLIVKIYKFCIGFVCSPYMQGGEFVESRTNPIQIFSRVRRACPLHACTMMYFGESHKSHATFLTV